MDTFSSSFLSALPIPKLLSSFGNKPLTITSSPTTFYFSSSMIGEQKTLKIKPLFNSTKTITRRPVQSFLTNLFNTLDEFITNFIDRPHRPPSLDPQHALAGNFFPVDELPPTNCPIIDGHLPTCLNGAYIRNGPNPQYLPRGAYHPFDGDGMLHSLRISDGRATLCSRYVKTHKYNVEHEAGYPILPNAFSSFHGITATLARVFLFAARVVAGEFNLDNGIGVANTSLALFGNQLFALCESDLTYSVKLTTDGDIETVRRQDFDGKLCMRMTAHPKTDPDTGETFAFRYGVGPPCLTFFRFNLDGSKQPDVPIFSVSRPSFPHDFAITKKYAVFPDIQIGLNLFGGGSLIGPVMGKVPRIGVIPRYAENDTEMRWFEVPGFNVFHVINAWDEEEEEDVIVMIAPDITPVEHMLDLRLLHASVEKVRIDLKTGTVTRFRVSDQFLDFGVINPRYVGRKTRYAYLAVGERNGSEMLKLSGVVKLDLSVMGDEEAIVACRMFGKGCYGGEPFFVARDEHGNSHVAAEDDGYLMTYVHDENVGESRFLVMDATSPSLEIVATVKLPHRVPYGFHGLFLRESDLQKL